MFINQARETHIKVSTLLRTLQGHTKSDRGAAMVEYALLVALIAVVAPPLYAGSVPEPAATFSSAEDVSRGVVLRSFGGGGLPPPPTSAT